MFFDGQLNQLGEMIPPPTTPTNCHCIDGYPYLDEKGRCQCTKKKRQVVVIGSPVPPIPVPQFGQLGARSNPEPMNCSCLHGTAVIDGNGNCVCLNDSIPPIINNPQQNSVKNPTVIYVTPGQTNPTITTVPVEDDTILGLPKWVAIIGGAAIGLYAISQMGEK